MRSRRLGFVTAVAIALLLNSSRMAGAEPLTLDGYITSPSLTQQIVEGVGKYVEIRRLSRDANEKYEIARIAFYEQLDKGLLGSTQEQEYFKMLDDKDIYYLSMYLTEGFIASRERARMKYLKNGGDPFHAAQHVPDLDMAVGGRIDGGIHDAEGGPFDAWVEAVRAALGTTRRGELIHAIPSPQQLADAIHKSSKQYEAYLTVRNRWEIKEWKFRRRHWAPASKTPAELADNYITYGLRPPIDRTLATMSPADRADAEAKIRPWLEQIRNEIFAYESAKVTPETAAEMLRKWNMPADRIAAFLTRLAGTKAMTPTDSLDAIARAMADEIAFSDTVKYGRSFAPKIDNIKISLLGFVKGSTRIEAEFKPPPISFTVEDFDVRGRYISNRAALAKGDLNYEPPFPTFQTIDDAAQAKLRENAQRAEAAKKLSDDAKRQERERAEAQAAKKEAEAQAAKKEKDRLASLAPKQETKQPSSVPPAAPLDLEVSGVRIGMSLSEADRIIRDRIKVVAVVEQVHPFGKGSIFDRKLYASEGGSQRVVVYWHPTIPDRVLGVSLFAELADFTRPEDVDNVLNQQFGPPTKIVGRSRYWTADWEAHKRGRCAMQQISGAGFEYTEGNLPKTVSTGSADEVIGAASETFYAFMYSDQTHWQEAASCPTTRVADVVEGISGRKPYLLVGLVDGKYVMDGLKSAAAGTSQKSVQSLDTLLKPRSSPPISQHSSNAVPGPTLKVPPPTDTTLDPSAPPFASQALAIKQRDLVLVWPGFAELRRLKPQEYDAALATISMTSGMTDVNNGISIISAAMDQVIKSGLEKLTRVDDGQVAALLKSQVSVYRAMESNFGEEFCGRAVENDLGKFREPSFVLSHLQKFIDLVKEKLDLQLKMIRAQEAYKAAPSRGAPNNIDLAPYTPQVALLQTLRGTKQYDKICGALTDFLNRVIAGADAGAEKARLTTLVSIQ